MSVQDLLRRARRRLSKVPAVRRLYDDFDILRKYRTLRPERVPLADSRHVIFVDPREQRGRAILRGYGAGQRVLKRIWRRAIPLVEPTVVLDVGANYGEFLFYTDYRPGAVVVGVEANPGLMKYLEKSRLAHSHRDQIELVCALAADAPGEPVPFYVDVEWSGRSSALKQERHQKTQVEMVSTTSVDELLASRVSSADRMLFKIDVEGFEPQVVAGMKETLRRVPRALGILEFNTEFIRRQRVDPDRFLDELREHFFVHAVEVDSVVDLTERSVAEAYGKTDVMTDLVVSTEREWLTALDA